MSDEQDNDRTPIQISNEFRQMIEDEVRQIEEQGGQSTDKMKSSLYEKWVYELLDTISVMCKHTVELEKVAASSVAKLEQKLQETADATHNFMHSNSNRQASTKLRDSGMGHSDPQQHDSTANAFSHGSREPLVRRLQESQESLQTYLERCSELQQMIDVLEGSNRDLKDVLAQQEEKLLRLTGDPSLLERDYGEKSRLQSDLDSLNRELAQETSQRKKLEKRVCKQSEEIKALTQEVAAKHDQVMQKEQHIVEVHQEKENIHMQINYRDMLIASLRKECKKLKKPGDPDSKSSSPNLSRKNMSPEGKERGAVKIVVEHHKESQALGSTDYEANMNKDQELNRLQKRLEELGSILKAKDKIISTIQAAAGPSRSQTLAHIHKMSPDELKCSLLNKEKEISEQRTLIGQLQEALISSKNKFDDLQRSGDHEDINPYSVELLNELAGDLHEARHQLKFYEEHNRDLSLEVMRIRNDKTEAEQYLERVAREKGEHLARTEAELHRLQEFVCEAGDHTSCANQIATLQRCLDQGARLLKEKNEQILELKDRLDEMCRGTEEQLRVLVDKNVTLAELEESLGSVSKERDSLLSKVDNLSREVHRKEDSKREQFEEKLRSHLKETEGELDSWKRKYEIINTNLQQKVRLIEEMRRTHEEETSQAMAQTVSSEKLSQVEAEVEALRSQLSFAKTELTKLRTKCEDNVAQNGELQRLLDLETARGRENKAEALKCSAQAEEQVKKAEQLQKDLDEKKDIYKSKEDEMKRLLRLSCENVQHLQDLNLELSVKADASERLQVRVQQLEAATKEAHRDLEAAQTNAERLQGRLEAAEQEAVEMRDRLGQFEGELVLSAERVVQLQGLLVQAQQERQHAADEAANLKAQLAEIALEHQAQQADLAVQVQCALAEKQHLEKSQKQLEDLCKMLSSQLGGQKNEREKYLRGLKQAAAERSQMCLEARQVLAVAREWLSEHRASAMELRQLRTERERLLKENNSLRHRSKNSTSVLNSWDCGLVDREESGFWSSHWTTQLDEVDQEIETFRRRTESWGEGEEDDEDCDGAEGRGDNGYQSGYQSGSSK